MTKREKQRLAASEAGAIASANGAHANASADEADFAKLTDLADMLLTSGELDIYSFTKEQLERWATSVLGREPPAAEAAGDGGSGDMFAGVCDVANPRMIYSLSS